MTVPKDFLILIINSLKNIVLREEIFFLFKKMTKSRPKKSGFIIDRKYRRGTVLSRNKDKNDVRVIFDSEQIHRDR
jgi:hypothetical protein